MDKKVIRHMLGNYLEESESRKAIEGYENFQTFLDGFNNLNDLCRLFDRSMKAIELDPDQAEERGKEIPFIKEKIKKMLQGIDDFLFILSIPIIGEEGEYSEPIALWSLDRIADLMKTKDPSAFELTKIAELSEEMSLGIFSHGSEAQRIFKKLENNFLEKVSLVSKDNIPDWFLFLFFWQPDSISERIVDILFEKAEELYEALGAED